MTPQEYAIKYAGRKVQIFGTLDVPRYKENREPFARVIGYYTNPVMHPGWVVIDFVEASDNAKAWDLSERPGQITLVVKDADKGWRVPIENVKLYDERPIVAYPHKCKLCKAPARKNVLCSNMHCKSRSGYLREVKSKIITPADKFIRCPKCNSVADSASGGFDDINHHAFTCPEGHRWQCKASIGDMVDCQPRLDQPSKFKWDGKVWERLNEKGSS